MPQGNNLRRASGERFGETRSRRPVRATHHVNQATSEALRFLIDSKYTYWAVAAAWLHV